MASEALRAFFTSLVSEADLTQLILDATQEDIHLEYKQKKNRSQPQLDDSDKWQFSRALSGFANSDGGVMLWGVEADNNERAAKLKPIADVFDFQARLKKSLLNTTQPAVEGVLIEVITSSGSSTDGFVKCLVPSSDRTPHRGMLAGREYYKRSTEGFYKLEHFDLEDMFGRRPVPLLQLSTHVVARGSFGGGGATTMKGLAILTITNVGRGSARAPYLVVRTEPPYKVDRYGLDGNGHEGMPRLQTADTERIVYTSTDVVIHPGVSHDVAGVEVYGYVDHKGEITMPAELRVRFDLSAENARLSSDLMIVTSGQIAEAVFPAHLYPTQVKTGDAAP
jgi:hypothetical protein